MPVLQLLYVTLIRLPGLQLGSDYIDVEAKIGCGD